jgi:hypothetical protein
MQTIIMPVGTSLRTNGDRNLPNHKKRPREHCPLRLNVRHYIHYDDETGLARIHLSRLVNLTIHPFRSKDR